MEQIQKPEARSPWSRGPAETTGVLKIFFGYAAGVGKTYAMLEAAHQAQKEGIDVVAGYIEPHARPDTLALLEGLETLPPAAINYRGIRLREFDLDLALQRKPQLILVDELAHTNGQPSYQAVPGCGGIAAGRDPRLHHSQCAAFGVAARPGILHHRD